MLGSAGGLIFMICSALIAFFSSPTWWAPPRGFSLLYRKPRRKLCPRP